LAALPELLKEMQVIHISGQRDWAEIEAARAELASKLVPGSLVDRYRAFPYLHEEIGAALTAADLVLSRAGASVLGEFPLFGLPAILVPYPYAWRYQQVNANYLAQKGAALVLPDEELADRLLVVVQELMRDQPRREAMRQAMRALAQPEAAKAVAQVIDSLVGEQLVSVLPSPGKDARP
jgi:UDP-N-acetylglucosamine--N-acetylmuramyl-(pentapeptide) pyrophosphoryl-undecaprenol N-acetylglucosamine transferase